MTIFDASDHLASPVDPQNFTGHATVARIDRLSDQPTVNMYRVTFQPGARTAWHAHTGVQLLLVIEGRCRVQKEQQPIHEVAAGGAIRIEPGERVARYLDQEASPVRGWQNNLDAPGAHDMMHLRRLMESRNFTTGVPDQSLIASDPSSGVSRLQATRGDGYAAVYAANGRTFRVNLGRISGVEVDALRRDLHALTKKNVHININEIKRPELDAKLVAQSIAEQLQNRVAFRRAMKRALTSAMRSGAKGVKVQVSGRLGGAEMARTEGYSDGRVPLHTLRADIDYGFFEARTTFGRIGVKVWIYKGDAPVTRAEREAAQAAARTAGGGQRRERPQRRRRGGAAGAPNTDAKAGASAEAPKTEGS